MARAANATRAGDGFRMVPASSPHRAGAGFASAPDRGDLLAYPARPQILSDGAYTWHRAGLSERHALAAIASGVLHVTTPSGENLAFRYQRYVEHDSGDWTWIGQIEGDAGKQAIVTFGARAVFGVIDQPGKPSLKLTMRDGASWLVETDPVRLALSGQQGGAHGDDMRLPEAADLPQSGSGAASLPAASAAAAAGTSIDVLVGYSNGFAAGLGGQSQAVTRIANLVDTTNQAYANSQVDARLRLVGTQQVNYTDASANDTALDELTGTRTVPVNPAFNELRAARDRLGADLVSFVRKYDRQNQDGCGVAWIIGGDQRPYTASSAGSAYSVVSDGREQQGNTSYFCREETFAHELGHNLGAQHDRATASSSGTLKYGAFAYSFGYKTDAANGNFYDIMAYGDSGQTAYRVFSNPRVSICGGRACGVENQADNARTFAQTMPVAATFRATVVATAAKDDYNSDGKSDLFMVNREGILCVLLMNGGTVTSNTCPAGAGSGFRIVGTDDFNGDGLPDVMWSNGYQLKLWLGNGTGGFSAYQTGFGYDSSWRIDKAADMNSDGKADLLMVKDGMLCIYFMNGSALASASCPAGAGAGFRIVDAADFNGDGHIDLMWSNGGFLKFWFGNGAGGFSSMQDMGPYDGSWVMSAAGDMNSDGKADLLSAKDGIVCLLFMNGATVTSSSCPAGAGAGFRIVKAADFNGDGKNDIMLSNGSFAKIWLGNGAGALSQYDIGGYDGAWTMQ